MTKDNNKQDEMDANVCKEEREMLDNDGTAQHGKLDETDNDGVKLNEDSDGTGDDLDVPGSELDDADEAIGEEDEENNYYSESDNKE